MRAILFVTGHLQQDRRLSGASLVELFLYDQPALRYPIANLMLWGIREILVLGFPKKLKSILGNGTDYGLKIHYAGLPQEFDLFALLKLHEKWVGGDTVCLMSAHNFFWGHNLSIAGTHPEGATIVAKNVLGYERYSWFELDSKRWRVPDLGFYHPSVLELADQLKSTGCLSFDLELLNRHYAAENRLAVERWGDEVFWCDLQDPDHLWEASCKAADWEEMTETKAACLEEAALLMGLIGAGQAMRIYQKYPPGNYRDYVESVLISGGLLPEEPRGLRLVQ